MPRKEEVPWSAVWALYRENAATFQSAFASLSARGFFCPREMRTELIHRFLLERARPALETFRPERGDVGAWLFVVFKRFVSGEWKRQGTSERKLVAKDPLELQAPSAEASEMPSDLATTRAAISELPLNERQVLEVILLPRGSLRKAARDLGISRWQTRQLLDNALKRLGTQLGLSTERDRVDVDNIRRALEGES